MVKRKRRILAVIIAVSMVFSSTGFTFAEDNLDNVSTEKATVTVQKEEPQKEEVKKEEPKKEEIKKEDPPKQEKEIKTEEPQKEEAKQEEPKKEEEEFQTKEENRQENEISNQKSETKSRNVKSVEEPQVKEEDEVSYPFTITINLHYKNANGDQTKTYTRTITKKNAEQDWSRISLSSLSNDYQMSSTLKYKFINWTGEGETYTKYQSIIKKGTDFTKATTLNYTANYKESRYIEIQPYFVYMTPNGEYTKTDYPKQSGWWGDSWSFTNKKLDNIVSGNTNFIYVPENMQYEYNGKWTNASGTEINGQTFEYENYTENTTVYYYAQYTKTPRYKVTINYIDNIARGSHQWATGEGTYFDGYSAIQDKDLKGIKEPADIPTGYTFKYWHCDFTNQNYEVGDDFTITKDQITENKVINLVATYDYQPQVEVIYNYKENGEWKELSSGAKFQSINIYKDTPQSLKSIKYWFYDEKGGESIPSGEIVSLPDIVPNVIEKQNIIEQTNVYAHYYGVTFVDEDGESVLKKRIEYQYDTDANDIEKPEEPTKEPTAQYTFFFDKWLPTIVNVIEEAIYQATYRSEINKYTVTWVNEDGTFLEVDKNVPYGEMPSYDGDTPTKESTAQYTYKFKEWTPTIKEVTGDITYTATYTATINKYPVTFIDYDNSIIQNAIEYNYGTAAADIKVPQDPTREATAEFTYEFNGWAPEITEVTGETVYKATYKAIKREYVIKFVDEDGTEFSSKSYKYGDIPIYEGNIPTKTSTAQYSYEFDKWTPEIVEVTKDATYTATYKATVRKYTVTYKPGTQGTFKETSTIVEYGSNTPTAPKTTCNKDYRFKKWNPSVADTVTGNVTYIAQWEKIEQEESTTPIKPDSSTPNKPKTKPHITNTIEVIYYGMGDIANNPIVKKPAIIQNHPLPLSQPEQYWALLNLLFALATCVLAFILIVFGFLNKTNEDENIEIKNKWWARIIAGLIGIASLIIFFLTENMNNPWIWIDKWTILMGIIFIINIIFMFIARHKEEEIEEDE